jgi:hypothetical protein
MCGELVHERGNIIPQYGSKFNNEKRERALDDTEYQRRVGGGGGRTKAARRGGLRKERWANS